MDQIFELIIVGGGPAGLSGALIAGRARRSVLVIDGDVPRNAAAPAVHSFLSRDGVLPHELRRASHEELARYDTVSRIKGTVEDLTTKGGQHTVRMTDGRTYAAPYILLALGLKDELPAISGVEGNWGRGVHHCPYCDGYEHRDARWGVLAQEPAVRDHAIFLRNWASHVTVFTNERELPSQTLLDLQLAGIDIISDQIAEVIAGDGHSIGGVALVTGAVEAIESFWIRPTQSQTPLVKRLGLDLREDGAIWRDEKNQTSRPGVYAAGDCAAGPVQQAILSAADGARSVFPIIHDLVREQ